MFKVTASTMGVQTRASLAAGTGYYTYRGNQPHEKPARAEPLPQNAKAMANRAERIAEYTRWRKDEGLTRAEAAARLHERYGFGKSAATYYEQAYKQQHPEAQS